MTGRIMKSLQLVLVLVIGYGLGGTSAVSTCCDGRASSGSFGCAGVGVSPVRLTTSSSSVEKKWVAVQKDETVLRGGSSISGGIKSEMIGVALFVGMDVAFRRAFKALGISFPSQLGGCVILFTLWTLLSATGSAGKQFVDSMVDALSPGQAWLSKLLPVFFVPGLAMLPVAPSVGSLVEVLKYLSIIIVGFFYSLGITVYSVEFVDSLLNGNKQKRPTAANSSTTIKSPAAVLSAASKPAFMAETLKALITCAVVSGAISVAATNAKHQYANPIQSLFLAFATVGGFVFGSRLPSSFTKIVHPLVTSTFVSWGTIQLLALLIGTSFADILGTFKSGSMELFKIGAGDALLFMLGASVVSLAVPMYGRRKLVKDNLPVVLTAMLVSSVGGLFGTAFYIRLIQVSSETVRISVLPRFVTTPLAIAILNILEGGSIPIGAAAVVLTGIFCGTFGRSILDSLGIKSPIARGLAIGASEQGLGVASLVSEKDAFPFGAVSMVMTAVGATTLVSIPAVKKLLLQIALK